MYSTIAPADVESRNDANPQFTPGALYHDPNTNKTYRYVQLVNENVTPAAKQVVYLSDTDTTFTGYKVTNDFSEAMSDSLDYVWGVLTYAATETYYTFIQTWGLCEDVLTNGDDDIAAGVKIIGAGDGTCNSMAANTAATNTVLGIAAADDDNAANTVDVFLTIAQ